MSISSVCKRWRSIAHSSPAIWSRISLELSAENSRLSDVRSVLSGFLRAVELHLHHSGEHPLTLKLDISGSIYQPVVPGPLLAFDLACNHSWCSFEMGGPYTISCIPKPRFDSIQNCRSLKNLAITVESRFSLSGILEPYSHLFPMLTNIPKTLWSSLNVNIVDDRIVDVFNYAFSPKELVLREGPECCHFTLSRPVSPQLCTSVLILKLELHEALGYGGPLVDYAFSSFTFPSLSCLAIMTNGYHPYQGPWPEATLAAFLDRSSCSLTYFGVKRISVSDVDLIAALKLMPSLVTLRVDDTPAGDDQISPITPRFICSLHGFLWSEQNYSSSALIPKLHELQLTFDGLEFDDSVFINMVSSRWLPNKQHTWGVRLDCLRVVTLRFNERAVDHAVYSPLDYLEKSWDESGGSRNG
ncbi:hypothetical protein BDP27DRAFT_1361290 [Rhodocollybia butyracea]|uniref:F-box domain-containing protein n=1 Tax=Rhodocollybia butyracea TaxID=206335 RepID=A0A9P5PZI3_9AGAR|nr:hypothetical protein BDP27DRAFT_1361290 [Rhodocollybia butyracea]